MKWRALAVAMAGLTVALASCSFDDAWKQYCEHPGRCSTFNDAGTINVAQGTLNRRIALTGRFLFDASTVTMEPATLGSASIASSSPDQVEVLVSVDHGIAVNTPFQLKVGWERPEDGVQTSPPLKVTAITVMSGGDDFNGSGTPDHPYGSITKANAVADQGDTIQLGAGQFLGMDPPCDPGVLKTGITVKGESAAASVVSAMGATGTCGLTLSHDQVVQQLTITGFAEGIRAADAGPGARPVVSNVTVTACDAGVAAYPGGQLQLQQVDLQDNEIGLLVAGGDVAMQQGSVTGSFRNGVQMTGSGGALALSAGAVQRNAKGFVNNPADELNGAGILVAANGGTATIGADVDNNGLTGVTVAGRDNVVTLDQSNVRGNIGGSTALLVKAGSDAGIFLRGTTLQNATHCIKVEGFKFFNGGTGDGTYGGNTLNCVDTPTDLQIWDARPASSVPALDFENTSLRGTTPAPGTNITSSDAGLGIRIDQTGNAVHFH